MAVTVVPSQDIFELVLNNRQEKLDAFVTDMKKQKTVCQGRAL